MLGRQCIETLMQYCLMFQSLQMCLIRTCKIRLSCTLGRCSGKKHQNTESHFSGWSPNQNFIAFSRFPPLSLPLSPALLPSLSWCRRTSVSLSSLVTTPPPKTQPAGLRHLKARHNDQRIPHESGRLPVVFARFIPTLFFLSHPLPFTIKGPARDDGGRWARGRFSRNVWSLDKELSHTCKEKGEQQCLLVCAVFAFPFEIA